MTCSHFLVHAYEGMGQVVGSGSVCLFDVRSTATGVETAHREAKAAGGKAIKQTERPSVVVGLPPVLNDDTCFLHRRILFTVQALIAEAAVETLNKAVQPRTAWFDVGRANID